jgi:hypothetical protein
MSGTRTVTLSSVGTSAMVLDPNAKSTTLILTISSSAVGACNVDISLDDPSTTPAPTLTWAVASSGANMTSSVVFDTGLIYTILSPVGGARIRSSVIANVITLKALQSVTA